MTSATSDATAVDVASLVDADPWSGLQKVVVCLAALAVLLDGFDSQLIGFAIPVLIRDWGVTRGDFAPVVAAGLIGMSLGSACIGLIADRLGRRTAVLGAVVLFGAATALIGFSPNLATMGLLRFVAGLGIGGALPTATTMTAEFTPARRRTLMVTLTIVCVPLGGMLAGFYAAQILPSLGWRALFWLGGALPLGLALVLGVLLPESPRFLARQPGRWGELKRLLDRMGRRVPAGARFVDGANQRPTKAAGLATLFAKGRLRDTLALSVAFFLCLLAVYSAFSWLPTMLTAQGLNIADASAGLTAYNLGGACGSLLCAQAITRFGSQRPLVACALGAAASAFVLEVTGLGQPAVLILGLGVHGLFVNAVQSTLYAVAAYVYPTSIRATGTASALAFGRLGAILCAFVGAAVISTAGPNAYLDVLGFSMLGAALMLLVLKHHIPAPSTPLGASAGDRSRFA